MIGTPRVHHRLTDSTNERGRALAAAGAPHGTLVTADAQSAGRGRQGRAWSSPPGSALLMSLVLRELQDVLPLAAAVAVCDALPVECAIKWPNDVWIERRKVAGILVEGRPQEGWAVLGIGLNVTTPSHAFPDELRDTATSLALAGVETTPEGVLAELLPSLDGWVAASRRDVLAAWRALDALRGEPVRWDGGDGTAAGIDDSGALLVETGGGHVSLEAGEVHLLR
jgi:BirA family transcriptional regulator, biotin operon repressor / biotin---[acetyl-CoA-carboxylase] ligase